MKERALSFIHPLHKRKPTVIMFGVSPTEDDLENVYTVQISKQSRDQVNHRPLRHPLDYWPTTPGLCSSRNDGQ